MPESETTKTRHTSVTIWRETLELLDRVCEHRENVRTRPAQLHQLVAQEARRLEILDGELSPPTIYASEEPTNG